MPDNLPDGITRDYILQAIQDFDNGLEHRFSDSTVYDVLFADKRYPPKAVIGLAAQHLTGSSFGPSDFTGGEQSKCFRILRSEGFEIVRKLTRGELIEEIEGYPSSTIFALDPSVDLDDIREGGQTGWLNRDRLAWLGLDGKTLHAIRSTDNLYKQHPELPKPESHLAYDLELGRIIVKSKLKPKPKRIFGSIPGYEIGSDFQNRKELSDAGLHRPLQAGISGSSTDGADSIVLSGGYEDDEDFGKEIIYTGHGGQDPATKEQVRDQELTRQNLALAISMKEGLPVRVIRGAQHVSPDSPQAGYRYGGLYRVEDYWQAPGRSGYQVCRFRLVKLEEERAGGEQAEGGSAPLGGNQRPGRAQTTTTRIIRDTKLSRQIKRLYKYKCQVCDLCLEGPNGPYAEGAHIRPLGRPHDGPDTPDNLLCLCPNHHYLFDVGAFSINDDYSLIGIDEDLTVHKDHEINMEHCSYHRRITFR